jgi:very-short-patch-repair endonuclease
MSDEDFWKLIEAAKRGWRVIRVSPSMLRNEPEQVIAAIRAAINVGL